MSFTLFKGHFVPAAGHPDGDSVRFRADNPQLLFQLDRQGFPPKVNEKNGTIQLRYEGIDAVEKKVMEPYDPKSLPENLRLIGWRDEALPEPRGYILSKLTGPYGRPISFVFKGEAPEDDGAPVYLSVERMTECVNYQLLEAGLVYPLFYNTLFKELRDKLASATKQARDAQKGLWKYDATTAGARWTGAACLPNLPPIFPKLWRRLEVYTREDDYSIYSDTLEQFPDFLRGKNDRLLLLAQDQHTGLDNVIDVVGDVLKMKLLPEEIVFDPK